jgi:hypothetical protein
MEFGYRYGTDDGTTGVLAPGPAVMSPFSDQAKISPPKVAMMRVVTKDAFCFAAGYFMIFAEPIRREYRDESVLTCVRGNRRYRGCRSCRA